MSFSEGPGVVQKAVSVLEEPLCDHCLGRQFAQLLTGHSNELRGAVLREAVAMILDSGEELGVDMSNFANHDFHNADIEVPGEREKCVVCEDRFTRVEEFAERILQKLDGMELDTFLVGTQLTSDMVGREERLWERVGIEWTEPIKGEMNREVGSIVEERMDATVDFKRPDVVALIDMETETVSLQINSIFIYGEYNKYENLPQTKWPGDNYETSVEEIIAAPFMEATGGSGHKFHGMGREDIDARCLGWRPFVLEILEPRKRHLKLQKLQRAAKEDDRIDVKNMTMAEPGLVEEVKSARPEKTYRAEVALSEGVDRETLNKLEILEGKKIYQETPSRVAHRRAEKLRRRVIKEMRWQRVGDEEDMLKLWIRAEAGTYIKELISGDDGRTYPSVAGLLGVDAECKQLDVLEIHTEKEYKPS